MRVIWCSWAEREPNLLEWQSLEKREKKRRYSAKQINENPCTAQILVRKIARVFSRLVGQENASIIRHEKRLSTYLQSSYRRQRRGWSADRRCNNQQVDSLAVNVLLLLPLPDGRLPASLVRVRPRGRRGAQRSARGKTWMGTNRQLRYMLTIRTQHKLVQ